MSATNVRSAIAILVCVVIAGSGTILRAAPLQEPDAVRFEMLYDELSSKQKALVDDWIARYAAMRSEDLEPEVYNEFPLSVKTTFAAVTHALSKTMLTGETGEPIVNDDNEPLAALDLVEQLDAVKGKVKGASGDEQFRIYVQLIPDAVSLLEDSREFSRGHDNTVYHKGYPQNFRSGNGVPSIQFSIALNGHQADIDVDYRSSKFPAALVNGHLTSGNSDVRAGDNYARHTRAWAGLQNWWNGWEGLGDWFAALYGARGLDIPEKTKKGNAEVEEAFNDFLHAWLVEQRPDVAMSYFSQDIYQCFADAREDEDATAPVEQRMHRKMLETVRVIGNPRSLDGVVQGVFLTSLEMPYIQNNPYHREFVLYRVPAERVIEFECGYQNMSIPRAERAQFRQSGEHVLGTFFLKSGDLRGVTAAVLWSREKDGWKMVSFELEPATGLVPDLHAPPAVPSARGGDDMEVDPELVRASDAFMTSWFVEKNFERVTSYVAPESYQCLDLFDETEGASTSDPQTRFREALQAVSEFVGDVDQSALADALAPVEPWGPTIRDVTPSGSPATLIALPDDAADAYRCVDPANAARTSRGPVEPVYGNFFATTFRVKLAGGEQPGSFLVLWSQVDGAWKVVAFQIVAT